MSDQSIVTSSSDTADTPTDKLAITIREARADDMALIRRHIIQERLDVSSLRRKNFLIAEYNGEIVGFGQVKQHPGAARELASLVTLPDYRGQQIARRLMQALEQRYGLPLYLLCEDTMEAYYKQRGYQVVGWRDLPAFIRLRYTAGVLLRVLGVKIVAMCKTT